MRPRYFILDEDGEPRPEPDVIKWGQWLEASRDRVLKQDFVEGEHFEHDVTLPARKRAHPTFKMPVGVSTVFLGLDHNWGPGLPLLWETLVFGTALDGEMRRYSARAEALRGHDEMVERVREVYHRECLGERLDA